MVVSEQLVQEVDCFRTDESLILGVDKAVPILPREPPQNVVVLRIEFDVISVQVLEEVIGAQHLRNLDKLV